MADQPTPSSANIVHLGDGVYAEFDGYHVVLRVNDHRSEPAVFLEPKVMDAIISFYNKITGKND